MSRPVYLVNPSTQSLDRRRLADAVRLIPLGRQGDMAFHMMIDIAELGIENRQPFEIVPDGIFIGHAITAVDLDRFLADVMGGLSHAHFGS